MYRAVGYKAKQEGVDVEDAEALEAMMAGTDIDFSGGDIILDGQVINDVIRTPEISMMASKCSAKQVVR